MSKRTGIRVGTPKRGRLAEPAGVTLRFTGDRLVTTPHSRLAADIAAAWTQAVPSQSHLPPGTSVTLTAYDSSSKSRLDGEAARCLALWVQAVFTWANEKEGPYDPPLEVGGVRVEAVVEQGRQPNDRLVPVEFTVRMPRVPAAVAETIREMGEAAANLESLPDAAALLDRVAAVVRRAAAESQASSDPLHRIRTYVESSQGRDSIDRDELNQFLNGFKGHRFTSADDMREFGVLVNELLARTDSVLQKDDGKLFRLSFEAVEGNRGRFRFGKLTGGSWSGAGVGVLPPLLAVEKPKNA